MQFVFVNFKRNIRGKKNFLDYWYKMNLYHVFWIHALSNVMHHKSVYKGK